MLKNTIIKSEYFWKTLKYLEQSQGDYVQVDQLLSDLGITEDKLLEFISFVNLFKFDLSLKKTVDGARLLKLPSPRPSITMTLSFSQWLGLQTCMPKIKNLTQDSAENFFNGLEEKVLDLHQEYPQFNFFKVMEEEREKQKIFFKICNEKRSVLEKIEDSINNNLCLILNLKEGRSIEIYIHQIVFLDGGLSVVAEDIYEKCLVYFDINNIDSLRLSFKEDYRPTYTPLEISDFISSVRSVIGKDDRLVLKIKDQQKVSLKPAYQFLGNPFITSNMNGEVIWAASVERSEQLYNWLDEIYDYVEILDPQNLLDEYLQYRSATSDTKKAS